MNTLTKLAINKKISAIFADGTSKMNLGVSTVVGLLKWPWIGCLWKLRRSAVPRNCLRTWLKVRGAKSPKMTVMGRSWCDRRY